MFYTLSHSVSDVMTQSNSFHLPIYHLRLWLTTRMDFLNATYVYIMESLDPEIGKSPKTATKCVYGVCHGRHLVMLGSWITAAPILSYILLQK